MNEPILSLQDVSVAFGVKESIAVTDRLSFEIFPREFFALVGESGCGKSVTAMSILRLLPVPSAKIVSGHIIFNGHDLMELSVTEMNKIRGSSISCIFQEPMQALNPVIPIGKQLLEVLRFQKKEEAMQRITHYLNLAGLSDIKRIWNAYPHEMSGGMLQRICIVMALLPSPSLIIADEPTTALDVTVQAQIMDVLKRLSQESNTAVLLITHNMGLVAQYASRVGVMYAGRLVETGSVDQVIHSPLHPYTKGLLAAIPDGVEGVHSISFIPGHVPNPQDFSCGCRFANRCTRYDDKCDQYPPRCGNDSHYAFCVHPESFSE